MSLFDSARYEIASKVNIFSLSCYLIHNVPQLSHKDSVYGKTNIDTFQIFIASSAFHF